MHTLICDSQKIAEPYWHSSSKRVKFCGQLPSFDQILSRYMLSFMSVGIMVIELREFKEKNIDKVGKLYFWPKVVFVIFGIQLSFDICYAVKSLRVGISGN